MYYNKRKEEINMSKWKRKVLVKLMYANNSSPLMAISDRSIFMIDIPTVMTDLKLREVHYVGNFLDLKKGKINCGRITSAEINVGDRKLSIKTGSAEYVFEIIDRMKESEKYYKTFSYFPESVPKYSEKDILDTCKMFVGEEKARASEVIPFSNNPYPNVKYPNGGDSDNTSKSSKHRRKRSRSKHKLNTETN